MATNVVQTPLEMTKELLDEAVAIAVRYDRNFANRDGTDAIHVPARICRLLALAVLNMHHRLQVPPKAEEKINTAPPLIKERYKAYMACKALVQRGQTITCRSLTEEGGWVSPNTGARHIRTLLDLGYLKRVGKGGIVAMTGLEPPELTN